MNCSFHGSFVGDGAEIDVGYGVFIGKFQESASAVFENYQNHATISAIGTDTRHKIACFLGNAAGKNLTMTDCTNYGETKVLF
mgnify:CR=1 FL=1